MIQREHGYGGRSAGEATPPLPLPIRKANLPLIKVNLKFKSGPGESRTGDINQLLGFSITGLDLTQRPREI